MGTDSFWQYIHVLLLASLAADCTGACDVIAWLCGRRGHASQWSVRRISVQAESRQSWISRVIHDAGSAPPCVRAERERGKEVARLLGAMGQKRGGAMGV